MQWSLHTQNTQEKADGHTFGNKAGKPIVATLLIHTLLSYFSVSFSQESLCLDYLPIVHIRWGSELLSFCSNPTNRALSHLYRLSK